jgi:gliding motility-associated-like protein
MLRLLHSLVVIILFLPLAGFAQVVPPPSYDSNGCDESPQLCSLDLLNGYVGSMENTDPDAPPCPLTCAGPVSCDNNIWFSFIAANATETITVDAYNCGSSPSQPGVFGMQGQVFQISDCSVASGFTAVSNCFENGGGNPDPAPATLNLSGLTPGGIYTIMLDGFAGSTCEFSVAVSPSASPAPELSNLTGPTDLCPGQYVTYCVDYNPGLPTIDNYLITYSGFSPDFSAPNFGMPYFQGSPNPTQVCIDLIAGEGSLSVEFTGANDCYPANVLELDVNSQEIVNAPEYATVCVTDGEYYYWDVSGDFYYGINPNSSDGSWSYSEITPEGCTSDYKLYIDECHAPLDSFEIDLICSSDLPYIWFGVPRNSAGLYQEEIENPNCDDCEGTAQLELFVINNEAFINEPDDLVCGVASIITLDGSNSNIETNEAFVTNEFLWTAGPGGSIDSDPTLDTVLVSEPGVYTLEITSTNVANPSIQCVSSYEVTVVEDAIFPDAPSIDGAIEQCGPGIQAYTIIPASTGVAPTGYVWSVNGGGTLSVSNDTAYVDWLTSGQVCLGAFNACDTSTTCIDVTVIELPVVTDILGSNIACESDQMGIYSVLQNGWTYDWDLTGGAGYVFDTTTNQLTVDFSVATSPTVEICVTGENQCTVSPQYCETVTLTQIPDAPIITGDTQVCVGESATYSIADDVNVLYIISTVADTTMGTITNGDSTSAVTVQWLQSGTDSICFVVANDCGAASQECLPVVIDELPTASFSNLDINFCPSGSDTALVDIILTGQTPWTVEVFDGDVATSYTYDTSPAEVELVGENSYTISSVVDGNGCVGTTSGQVNLIPYISPTAILSGSGGICEGSSDCVNLEVILDQQPGWSIRYKVNEIEQPQISGITSSPFTLEVCEPGDVELIEVIDGNGCVGTTSGIVSIENLEIPTVSIDTFLCDPATGATYQVVLEISGGSGTYFVDSPTLGGTLTGSTYTSGIIISEQPYEFEIYDSNNCDTVLIQGTHVCNCLNEVGDMGTNLIEVCDPGSAIALYDNSTQVLLADDTVSFVLHEGIGLSLENPIAFNSVPEFSFQAGMTYGQSYYISAICGTANIDGSVDTSDLCLKVAQGTEVKFYELPDITLTPSDSICIGETFDINIDFIAGEGLWNAVYTDDISGNIDTLIVGINDNPYTLSVNPSVTTTYTFTEVYNSNCNNFINQSVTLEILESPEVDTVYTECTDTGEGYIVTIEISGGNPTTYEVLSTVGGTLTGNTFISNEIVDNTPYSFELTNGFCDTILIESAGPIDCPCLSQVGDLSEIDGSVCGDGPIDLSYSAATSFLDGNDTLEYILYEGAVLTNAAIVQQSTLSPNFSFVPGMVYDSVYHVVAVVGNDNAGAVNLSDPCVSISSAIDVIFYEIPSLSISASDTICIGEDHTIELTLTSGQAPWNVVYQAAPGGSPIAIENILDPTYELVVSPTTTTTYTFTEVYTSNCSELISESLTLDVFESPEVDTVYTECTDTGEGYTVTIEISGGNPTSYEVLSTIGGTLTGNTFISNEIADNTPYSFELTNGFCDTILIESAGPIDCPCLSQVGDLSEIDGSVCGDGPIDLSYSAATSFLDGNDTLEYILYEGSVLTNAAIVQQSTLSPNFSFVPGMVYDSVYHVVAVVGNANAGAVNLSDPCISISSAIDVIFYEIPSLSISASDTICIGEDHTIELTLTSGQAPWNVVYQAVPGGSPIAIENILDPTYELVVSPTTTTTYTFTEVYTSNCSELISESLTLDVFESPEVDTVYTECTDTGEGYTVTIEISGGNPTTYEVLSTIGGTLTGNTFISNEIGDNTPYSFELTNGFCDTILIESAGPIDCPCLSQVGDLSEIDGSVCGDGPIDLSYSAASSFLDGNDTLEYILYEGSVLTNAAIVQQSTLSPNFSFVPGMVYDSVYHVVAVVGNDNAGAVNLSDPCVSISSAIDVIFYEIPVVELSGDTEICYYEQAELTLTFTAGQPPFEVILTDGSSNDTISDIQTFNYVHTVNPDTTSNYTVLSGGNSNCTITATGNANVIVNPELIISNITESIDVNNEFVTVSFEVEGGTEPYIVTEVNGLVGVDISFDNLSSTFTCSFIPCGAAYSFEVDDQNGCGPYMVSGTKDCPCITNVGAIVPDANQVCNDTVSFDLTGVINDLDGNDTVQYILHNGDGVPLQYANAANEFIFDNSWNYGQPYTISAIAGNTDINGNVDFNDPCFSTAGEEQVIFYEVPNAILSGGGDLCENNSMDVYVEFTSGVSPWTVTLLNETTSIPENYILDFALDTITLSPSDSSVYTLISVVDSENVCTGTMSGSIEIYVNDSPEGVAAVTEDYDNEELTVTIDVSGGDSNYTVLDEDGIALTTIDGIQFVSQPYACDQVTGGTEVIFYISDSNSCEIFELPVFLECSCFTSIGDFATGEIDYCYGDLISFDPITTFEFDGNDVLNYILTSDLSDLSNSVAVSQTNEFTFDPSIMQCGVDYFIVGVAGDNAGGGLVDLNDQCLAVSAAMTIQVYCPVEFGFVEESVEICVGETAFVNTFANTVGLFDLVIEDPFGVEYEILGVEAGSQVSFEPVLTGEYTLVMATELATGLSCSSVLSDPVEIIVYEPGIAGVFTSEPEFCENSNELVVLADLLEGEDANGVWTAIGNYSGFNPIQGSFNIFGQSAGTYEFTYTVLGEGTCPDVSTNVSVLVKPNPLADAGVAQTITCNELSVNLGGDETSQGSDVSYTWSFNGDLMPGQTNSVVNVDQAGTYLLTVEADGCAVSDEVLVDDIVETLVPSLNIDDPNCFGANNGSIIFADIDGGQGPYVYSIDNGENFQSSNLFDELYADTYSIVAMDINGCESQSIEVNIEDPEQISVELDLFVAQGGDPDNKEYIEDGIVGFNDTVIVQANLLNEGTETNISWYPADLTDCDDCDEITFVATNTVFIEVTVGAAGCEQSDNLSIFVEKESQVFVPSVFTPNGDIANDFLQVSVGSYVQNITVFEIFDRWGNKVYGVNNILPASTGTSYWDGTLNGQNCQSGVYVYIMEVEYLDGTKQIVKGDVTLTR